MFVKNIKITCVKYDWVQLNITLIRRPLVGWTPCDKTNLDVLDLELEKERSFWCSIWRVTFENKSVTKIVTMVTKFKSFDSLIQSPISIKTISHKLKSHLVIKLRVNGRRSERLNESVGYRSVGDRCARWEIEIGWRSLNELLVVDCKQCRYWYCYRTMH